MMAVPMSAEASRESPASRMSQWTLRLAPLPTLAGGHARFEPTYAIRTGEQSEVIREQSGHLTARAELEAVEQHDSG